MTTALMRTGAQDAPCCTSGCYRDTIWDTISVDVIILTPSASFLSLTQNLLHMNGVERLSYRSNTGHTGHTGQFTLYLYTGRGVM